MQVKVEAVSLKKTKNGKEYTGIKSFRPDGKWVNFWGNQTEKLIKGKMAEITDPEPWGDTGGLWAKVSEPTKSIQPEIEPELTNARIEPSQKRGYYDALHKVRDAWAELGAVVQSPEAFPAMSPQVTALLNFYVKGELIDDPVEEIQTEDTPF